MSDAERFEAFVRRYQDLVFATAVRLLGRPSDAEDVAQTVFLRAFQRFDRLQDEPAAAAWLRTVTRNACLNHLARYRARWQFFSELGAGAEAGIDVAGSLAAAGEAPDATILRAEAHGRLEDALRRLPDHQRVPVVLFHFEDMAYQDIARALGVSVGKVKTDIHRGREALRRVLRDDHGVT